MKLLLIGDSHCLTAECIKDGFRVISESDFDKTSKVFMSKFDKNAIKYADLAPNIENQLYWHSKLTQFEKLGYRVEALPYAVGDDYATIVTKFDNEPFVLYTEGVKEPSQISTQLEFATLRREHNGSQCIAIQSSLKDARYRMYCIKNRILGIYEVSLTSKESKSNLRITSELINMCKVICSTTGLQYYSVNFVIRDDSYLFGGIDVCPDIKKQYVSKIVDKVIRVL